MYPQEYFCPPVIFLWGWERRLKAWIFPSATNKSSELQDPLAQFIHITDPAMPFLCIAKVCFWGGAAWQCCLERSLQNPSIDSISLGHAFYCRALCQLLLLQTVDEHVSFSLHTVPFLSLNLNGQTGILKHVFSKKRIFFILNLSRRGGEIKPTVAYVYSYIVCMHVCACMWKKEKFIVFQHS